MDQYNTRSSESQNFYINIPDCPFMLILFHESELNCGMKYGTAFLYTVFLHTSERLKTFIISKIN